MGKIDFDEIHVLRILISAIQFLFSLLKGKFVIAQKMNISLELYLDGILIVYIRP